MLYPHPPDVQIYSPNLFLNYLQICDFKYPINENRNDYNSICINTGYLGWNNSITEFMVFLQERKDVQKVKIHLLTIVL